MAYTRMCVPTAGLAVEVSADEFLVDDGHLLRRAVVVRSEGAAGLQRNAERFEIARTHHLVVGAQTSRPGSGLRLADDLDSLSDVETGERQAAAERGGAHSGQALDFGLRRLIEGERVRGRGIAAQGQRRPAW